MKTNLEHNGVVRDPHPNAKFHLNFLEAFTWDGFTNCYLVNFIDTSPKL